MKSYVAGKDNKDAKEPDSKKPKRARTPPAKKPSQQPDKEDTASEAHSDVPPPQDEEDGEGEEEEQEEDDPEYRGSDDEDGDLFKGPFKAAANDGGCGKKMEEHPRWQGLPNKTTRLQGKVHRDLLASLPVSLSRPVAEQNSV